VGGVGEASPARQRSAALDIDSVFLAVPVRDDCHAAMQRKAAGEDVPAEDCPEFSAVDRQLTDGKLSMNKNVPFVRRRVQAETSRLIAFGLPQQPQLRQRKSGDSVADGDEHPISQ
jgi:hypothetical protein